MYGNGSGSSLRNKIANKIAIYGMSFLGIGVIINFIIKSFSIKFSTSLEGLGLFDNMDYPKYCCDCYANLHRIS